MARPADMFRDLCKVWQVRPVAPEPSVRHLKRVRALAVVAVIPSPHQPDEKHYVAYNWYEAK